MAPRNVKIRRRGRDEGRSGSPGSRNVPKVLVDISDLLQPFPPPLPDPIRPPSPDLFSEEISKSVVDEPDLIDPFPGATVLNPFPSIEDQSSTSHKRPPIPPAKYSASMVLCQAKVKSVVSGDTIVLVSIDNPLSERVLSFAYVTAPHLYRTCDEMYAFESRDFLRKLCVGKHVQFEVLYTTPTTKREHGTVSLNDGRKLIELMVAAGYVKLREDAGKKEDSEKAISHVEQLRLLEAKAKNQEIGIFKRNGKAIEVVDIGDPQAFIQKYKNKPIAGMVERVLSGDRMLLRLFTSDTQHVQSFFLSAGIRAPQATRIDPATGQSQAAEEYGDEARIFVEDKLLQRNVLVEVLALSPHNQPIAHIVHPKGNISMFVLQAGLARCSDFHSVALGTQMGEFRKAEKQAQNAKLGLWKNHVGHQKTQEGEAEVTVVRIITVDILLVRNKAGEDKRIYPSSVRGPRSSEASEASYRDEAKEFLRKKLIGKHVRITIDGSVPATAEYETKEGATIKLHEKNVGLLLVEEGLATVIRHRRDDTVRSPFWDQLLVAQEQAKQASRGIWSGKASAVRPYRDISDSVRSAKRQLGFFERQNKIPAIVDYIKGCSRFSIFIPKESVRLRLVLGGIIAPKSPYQNEEGEPYGKEAHELAVKRLEQRDVEVHIQGLDKSGGFIGELFIAKENFAKILVEEGFARVHGHSAENSVNAAVADLQGAEKRAKEARRGRWVDYTPPQETQKDDSKPTIGKEEVVAPPAKDYRNVIVTDVDQTGKLKMQFRGTGTKALDRLMDSLNSFHLSPANSAGLSGPPKVGDYVASKFTVDDRWYRARIRSNDRTAEEAEVVYIDYGNMEKVPWSGLRPLTQAQFTTQELKAQAIDATLALVQFPNAKDYLNDALNYVYEMINGLELVANINFEDPSSKMLYVTLYDEQRSKDDRDSLNGIFVDAGHLTVTRTLTGWEKRVDEDYVEVLRQKEAEAKKERRGLWEYGDLSED